MVLTYQPIRKAAGLGILAFVTGYLVTVLLAGGQADAILAITVTGGSVETAKLGRFLEPPSRWIGGAWLYYNAQFIPTRVPTADAIGGFASLTSRNLLLAINGALLGLYLIPFVCVFSAGFLTVRTSDTYGARGHIVAGALVASSYYPLLLIGSFVFFSEVKNVTLRVSPAIIATAFIGLIYPVLIGALGGWVAADPEDRDEATWTWE